MKLKLNLFCGFDYRPGFINIDAISAFPIDLIWDLQDKLPYSEGSVDEIRIQDGLEHLNYREAERALRHWIQLLKPGGSFFLQLPDWDLIDKNNLKQVFGELDWKGVDLGDYGVHKWAYTKKSIRELLERNSLKIVSVENRLGNILIEALKKIEKEMKNAE